MHRESAQGTVEYVGVLLAVAILLGALVGAFGLPSPAAGLASSFIGAFTSAFGTDAPARSQVQASAEDEARFARATDAGVAPDDRPSLRDVRLDLIAAHGDGPGRRIYRELVLESLRRIVPGLGGPTRFGTIDRSTDSSAFDSGQRLISRLHSLSAPAGGDRGDLETPIGEPNAHVVTAAEQDDAFRHAVHPDGAWRSLALDGVGAIPGVGTVRGARRVAIAAARGLAAVVSDLGDAQRAIASLSPGANEIPAGSREGDEIVTWTATRRSSPDAPSILVQRTAVVRDGVLLAAGIDLLPGSAS
jgi:hypothetical protein